ncbi:MAG: penicillin acylase family protein [Candidatus Calescibacterium sp.]|nr:penicillin acylase family protein [Candidatus Calescibacterium sp.]
MVSEKIKKILSFALVFTTVMSCSKNESKNYSLSAPVHVIIDRCGVPHIFAQDEKDAFFVFGYIQAHFRLFQMDISRRDATGRLAEIFPEKLTDDIMNRMLGFKKVSQDSEKSFEDIGIFEKIKFFVEGINKYIDDAKNGGEFGGIKARIPPQYSLLKILPEYFSPYEVIAIGKKRSFELSGGGMIDIAMKLLDLIFGQGFENTFSISQVEKTSIVEDFPKTRINFLSENFFSPVLNSNNFVVSPTMTSVGYPILENDPHLSVGSPSVFFPFQINSPQYSIKGFTFPGIPIALVGASEKVCWGVTATLIDTIDIVFVPIEKRDEKYYVKFGNKWIEAIPVEEEIFYYEGQERKSLKIRFLQIPNLGFVLDDGGLGEFDSILKFLIGVSEGLGDIVSEVLRQIIRYPYNQENVGIAMIWTGHKPTSEVGAFYFQTRAKDVFTSMTYYKYFQAGIQNFIVADTSGNIGYFPAGEIPIRPAGVKPYLPQPSSELFWIGVVPPDFIPRTVNPQSGYIATANNDLVGQTFDNNPLNERFYLGPVFDIGFRGWRISSLIQQNAGYIDKVTAAMIVNDTLSGAAITFLEQFFKWVGEDDVRSYPVPATLREAMEFIYKKMKNWNFYSDSNLQEPLFFEMVFYFSLALFGWDNFIRGYVVNRVKDVLQTVLKGTKFEGLVSSIYDLSIAQIAYLLFSISSDPNVIYRMSYPVISGNKGQICTAEQVSADDIRKIILGEDICPKNEFLRALSETANYLLNYAGLCVSEENGVCQRFLCKEGKFQNCVFGDFSGKRFHYIANFGGSELFEASYKGKRYFRKSGGSTLVYAADINTVFLPEPKNKEDIYSVEPAFRKPEPNNEFVAFEQSAIGQTLKYICEAKPTGTEIHFIIPGGTEDDPDSPYFSNMNEAWSCSREWLSGITQNYCAIPPDFLPKDKSKINKEFLFSINFAKIEDDFSKLISGDYHSPPYCRGKNIYLIFK